MPKELKVLGYRVDVLSAETDRYTPYSGDRTHHTLEFATSLGDHLKRSKVGGRIVEIPTERVVEEWSRTYVPESWDASKKRVQTLRDKVLGSC